ncbi:hypothetical protein [Homoserinibacter gongjuensis]|nr:hypothetical protein [Homoserinibacter gongjuensis]
MAFDCGSRGRQPSCSPAAAKPSAMALNTGTSHSLPESGVELSVD